MNIDLKQPWNQMTFVAFDTETSGAYPLGSEIVEFGAVKWKEGRIVDEYQTLLKPSFPMSDFIIGIHGISNEMVATAPLMSEKINEIKNFFGESILMAHHAPFDMGFLAVDFEKHLQRLPENTVLCTSLLSRVLIPESSNHKLQTLIPFLKIPQGAAHRALDDAKACLEVGLECLRRMGPTATIEEVLKKMRKPLDWNKYSLLSNSDPLYKMVVHAISAHQDLDFVYEGGSVKGKTRRMTPIGIVRNPDGDYVMGICHLDRAQKRFYFNKIKDAQAAFSI